MRPVWYRYGQLRTEVLEQDVKGEFLLDAEVAVPHDGGEFRFPWRRGRVADEPSERMRRRHRGFVGHVVVPLRPPVHPVTHSTRDPDAAPVEVAVVTSSPRWRQGRAVHTHSPAGRGSALSPVKVWGVLARGALKGVWGR